MDEHKICTVCKKTKPLTDFYDRPERLCKRKSACKSCVCLRVKAYRKNNRAKIRETQRRCVANNPELYRALARKSYLRSVERNGGKTYTEDDWQRSLKKLYGISYDEYAQLLSDQSNCCAICHKTVEYRLCVDHDHSSGAVRGLLCKHCNFGISHFKDDPYLLSEAIKYLS